VSEQPIVFRVQRGDTLTVIARRFRVGVAAIVARNHLASADRVAVGETLLIPRAAALALAVDPPLGALGQAFRITLRGAIPSETITFHLAFVWGTYDGAPHVVPADGVVSATYQTAVGDHPGVYSVTAVGSLGTRARAYFGVDPPPPS